MYGRYFNCPPELWEIMYLIKERKSFGGLLDCCHRQAWQEWEIKWLWTVCFVVFICVSDHKSRKQKARGFSFSAHGIVRRIGSFYVFKNILSLVAMRYM